LGRRGIFYVSEQFGVLFLTEIYGVGHVRYLSPAFPLRGVFYPQNLGQDAQKMKAVRTQFSL